MSFLNKIFGKEEKIDNYEEFWEWFAQNEGAFYKVVKQQGNFESDFFDIVLPRLNRLKEGLFLLSGMSDEDTVELIITPDGNVSNIVFAEEIVAAAPRIKGWKFTALKPQAQEEFNMRMGDITISANTLQFYEDQAWEQPDNVEIVVIHKDVNQDNQETMGNAIYMFLDSYLGELFFINTIDGLTINSQADPGQKLLPITELRPYLEKRRAEFVEKYDVTRTNTDEDPHSMLEAELENGLPLLALVNNALIKWDSKPSHPWIARITIKFAGNEHGMPDDKTFEFLADLEDELIDQLKDLEGYLNVGRETTDGNRSIFFACKEFRKPSKVMHEIQKKYSDQYEMKYDVYKDKYWQSLDRFIVEEAGEFVN